MAANKRPVSRYRRNLRQNVCPLYGREVRFPKQTPSQDYYSTKLRSDRANVDFAGFLSVIIRSMKDSIFIASTPDSLDLSVQIKAPMERAWWALTTAEGAEQWGAGPARFDATEEG